MRFSSTVWEVSDANSAPAMSAVHFYFGRHLAQNLPDMPIGLITSAVGATAIERWATCAGSGTLYTGQIVPLQVVQKLATTAGHGEKTSAGMEILAMHSQMLGQVIDTGR